MSKQYSSIDPEKIESLNRSRLFPSNFVLTIFRRNVKFYNLIIKNIHYVPATRSIQFYYLYDFFFLRSLVIYTTRSILSGNPSLVRSFLVFLSVERSLNSVYIYLSTVARGSQHDFNRALRGLNLKTLIMTNDIIILNAKYFRLAHIT